MQSTLQRNQRWYSVPLGWTGEAVGNIQTRLLGLKMNVFEDGFKVTFVPSEEDLENAKEFGKSFALSF